MNDVEPPDEVPEEFLKEHPRWVSGAGDSDDGDLKRGPKKELMRKKIQRVIEAIMDKVFPLIREYLTLIRPATTKFLAPNT